MDVRLDFCSLVCDCVHFNLTDLISVNMKLMKSSQCSVSMWSQREWAKTVMISRYISLVRSEFHYNPAEESNKSSLQQTLGFCTIFCVIYRLPNNKIKFGKWKKWQQSSKLPYLCILVYADLGQFFTIRSLLGDILFLQCVKLLSFSSQRRQIGQY